MWSHSVLRCCRVHVQPVCVCLTTRVNVKVVSYLLSPKSATLMTGRLQPDAIAPDHQTIARLRPACACTRCAQVIAAMMRSSSTWPAAALALLHSQALP